MIKTELRGKLVGILLIAVIITSTFSGAVASEITSSADSLLENTGFESGALYPWYSTHSSTSGPDFWVAIGVDDERPYEGEYGAYIDIYSDENEWGRIVQEIEITPGERLTLEAELMYELDLETGYAELWLVFLDNDMSSVGSVHEEYYKSDFGDENNWIHVALPPTTAPSNAKYVRVMVGLADVENCVLNIDNVILQSEPSIDAEITLFDVEEGTFHPGDTVGATAEISNEGDTYTFNIEYAIRDSKGAYYVVYEKDWEILEGMCLTLDDELDWTIPSDIAEGKCWGRLIVSDPDKPSTYYDIEWDYNAFTVEEPSIDAEITLFDVEEGTFHPGDTVGATAEISNEGDTYTFNIEYAIRDSDYNYHIVYDEDREILKGMCLTLDDELDWTIPPDIAEGECWGRLIVSDPDSPSTIYNKEWDYNAFEVIIPEKPDLTFKEIYFTDDALPPNEITAAKLGQKVYAHLTLMNKGGKDVDKTKVELFREKEGDDELLGSREVTNIPSGGFWSFAIPFVSNVEKCGKYKIYAKVDPEDLVDESNEDNNEVDQSLEVIPPDISLKILDGFSEYQYLGDKLNIKLEIENNEEYRIPEHTYDLEFIFLDIRSDDRLDTFQVWSCIGSDCEYYWDPITTRVQVPSLESGEKCIFFTISDLEPVYISEDITPTLICTDKLIVSLKDGYYPIKQDTINIQVLPGVGDAASILNTALTELVSEVTGIPFLSFVVSLAKAEYYELLDILQETLRFAVKYEKTGNPDFLLEAGKNMGRLCTFLINKGYSEKVVIEAMKDQLDSLKGIANFAIFKLGLIKKLLSSNPNYFMPYFLLACPADLHLYDGGGNHVGLNPIGEIEEDIIGSLFTKWENSSCAIIVNEDLDKLKLHIHGLDTGHFNLEYKQISSNISREVKYKNIPTSVDSTAEIENIFATLIMQIDEDGDGNIDYTKEPDLVNNLPVANFTYSPKEPSVNQPVTFNASSSLDIDGSIVNYCWNFGDGSNGTGKVVTHSYSNLGNYWVTLTVEDDKGDKDSHTQVIEVLGDSPIRQYDTNSNNRWEKSEAIKAVNDYLFEQKLDKLSVIGIVNGYLFGWSVDETIEWIKGGGV